MPKTGSVNLNERLNKKNHPCFNEEKSKKYSRIHLPVAYDCNIQCNYCNRKYDCVNESRPGVTSKILTPKEACELFLRVKSKIENLSVVGFAGPGDALANFEKVKETVNLIKDSMACSLEEKVFPRNEDDIMFCLSTNGLLLSDYAQEIINIGITHLTVTINTVDEALVPLIYEKISYKGANLPVEKAAGILIQNQLSGLKELSSAGLICKVNILCLEGINDFHAEEVVKTVKAHGAFMTNITKLIPAKGSKFENKIPIEDKKLMEIRKKCSAHLKQMYHCKQCRADSIGLLSQDKFNCF